MVWIGYTLGVVLFAVSLEHCGCTGTHLVVGHATTITTLSYAIRFWSKGKKRALFLRHEGFLYVSCGCLLSFTLILTLMAEVQSVHGSRTLTQKKSKGDHRLPFRHSCGKLEQLSRYIPRFDTNGCPDQPHEVTLMGMAFSSPLLIPRILPLPWLITQTLIYM